MQATDTEEDLIILNPGNVHILKMTDILFYISITREEDMTFLLYRDKGQDNPALDKSESLNPGTALNISYNNNNNNTWWNQGTQ